MEKLRLAKRTDPQVSFHWCKSNFVSLRGTIRDWSFISTILQAMKEITQKLCTPGLCRKAISYSITPQMEVSGFVCMWIQFCKAHSSLPRSMVEYCSSFPLDWACFPGCSAHWPPTPPRDFSCSTGVDNFEFFSVSCLQYTIRQVRKQSCTDKNPTLKNLSWKYEP